MTATSQEEEHVGPMIRHSINHHLPCGGHLSETVRLHPPKRSNRLRLDFVIAAASLAGVSTSLFHNPIDPKVIITLLFEVWYAGVLTRADVS